MSICKSHYLQQKMLTTALRFTLTQEWHFSAQFYVREREENGS
jgi:hypothetical protein